MKKPDPASSPQGVEFLFLASHGLLSPISAIRWGANRLKRTDTKKLTKEQKALLDHIQANAAVLSKLFGSMLLLARNEDRTYTLRPEGSGLETAIQSEARTWKEETGGVAEIECEEGLKAYVDSAMLEALLQNLFTVFAEAAKDPKHLTVTARAEDGWVQVVFSATMEIPYLRSVRTIDNLSESRPIVGGTAGLLLSLSHALAGFVDGTLDMREEGDDGYVITLKLPVG
jgi:K+-sensing histidine kinase KdpD